MTRAWLALGVVCLGVLVIGVDGTVLAVATPLITKNVLGKSHAAVEVFCHGRRPGTGSSRRIISPIIAHLIIASLVSGSRS